MTSDPDTNTRYKKSDNIIARDIEGELILVPIRSDIADLSDALFTLNTTGVEIWNRLDGKIKLNTLINDLQEKFGASPEEISKDVNGLIQELLKCGLIEKID